MSREAHNTSLHTLAQTLAITSSIISQMKALRFREVNSPGATSPGAAAGTPASLPRALAHAPWEARGCLQNRGPQTTVPVPGREQSGCRARSRMDAHSLPLLFTASQRPPQHYKAGPLPHQGCRSRKQCGVSHCMRGGGCPWSPPGGWPVHSSS